MKKSHRQDKTDKVVVALVAAVFILLVIVGIKSRQVDKLDHYIECSRICHPFMVDKERSRIHCTCLENNDGPPK